MVLSAVNMKSSNWNQFFSLNGLLVFACIGALSYVFPWQIIDGTFFSAMFVSAAGSLLPSVKGLSNDVLYFAGIEARVQLALSHLAAASCTFALLLKTKPMPVKRHSPAWVVLALGAIFGLFALFFLWLLGTWDGTFSRTEKDAFHHTEAGIVGVIVVWWYLIGACLAMIFGALTYLIKRNNVPSED